MRYGSGSRHRPEKTAAQIDAQAEKAVALVEQTRAQVETADKASAPIWSKAWRKQLITVFEAAGPASEVARNGRRRLSSLLFS